MPTIGETTRPELVIRHSSARHTAWVVWPPRGGEPPHEEFLADVLWIPLQGKWRLSSAEGEQGSRSAVGDEVDDLRRYARECILLRLRAALAHARQLVELAEAVGVKSLDE